MNVETVARTDVGRVRDHNEDSVLTAACGEGALVAVADGMGGHRAGDVASEVALEAFTGAVEDGLDAGTAVPDALTAAAVDADEAVTDRAESDSEQASMGTTLVGAYVEEDAATVVNVGDSRAYHVTDGAIEQVTVDHSMVQQLVESGVIEPDEAATHPQRNVVSQALGASESVDPDTFDLELTGTLLLCSDGLTEEVPDPAIREVISGSDDLAAAADELIDRSNDAGGSDNVSVVLVR
jgi:serine/threonine protein phosphatase PrpC